MSKFRGTVYADRWPFKHDVEATNYHVAAARLVTAWEQRFKGQKRPSTIKIELTRGAEYDR